MKGMNMRLVSGVFLLLLLIFRSSVGMCAEDEAPVKLKLPDLVVGFISRTPRYPAYLVSYDNGVPVSVNTEGKPMTTEEQANTKRRPEEGEEVTFTATVLNQGVIPTGAFEYAWYVDDKLIEKGKHDGLDGPSIALEQTDELIIEGETFKICRRMPHTFAEIQLKWHWKEGDHDVMLVLDPDNKIKETSKINNRLVDRTNAVSFIILINRSAYNKWSRFPNTWGSYCFEDWLRHHVNLMHKKFRESVHPLTPNGILERIRIDAIKIQADGEWRESIRSVTAPAGWDSQWDFTGYRPTVKYCKEDDWSLLKGWGSELGLIDIHLLDTESGNAGNMVRDDDGIPILLGYRTPIVGMMGEPGDVTFSEHSAHALNLQKGRRRGYRGDYLYDIPVKNFIQVLDLAGELVPDVQVTVYQQRSGHVVNRRTQTAVTDRKGLVLLSNRNATYGVTEQGFTQRDNPFADIDVMGANGLFFLVLKARGVTDYQWLSIADLNLAYWRGNKEKAVFVIKSYIPSMDAPAVPENMRLDIGPAADSYRLKWDKPLDPRIKQPRYNVYRRANSPPRWELVKGNISEPRFKLDGPGRYTVMTLGRGGSLSGPSKEVRLVRLEKPWGISINRDGWWIIKDTPVKVLTAMKPDGTFIGLIGSEGLDLNNAQDIAVNSKNQIIATDVPDGYVSYHGFRILTPEGFPLKNVWREKGRDPGSFDSPKGVSVDKDDRIIVADTGNHRIQVFSPSGEFLFAVGEKGSKLDQFDSPAKAIIDDAGALYVVDSGNNRVQIMEPAEDSYATVQEIKGLNAPTYIALDDKGYLYVSNTGANTIEVYRRNSGRKYEAVNSYKGPAKMPLKGPVGIAVDEKNGRVVIVDAGNHRVIPVRLDEIRGGKPER